MTEGYFPEREMYEADPKIYEILLKRYKIVPEQALFFDPTDLKMGRCTKGGIFNGAVFNTDIPLQMP